MEENLLRRGHVIMPFGVGAMYEFENDTLLAADLEYWEGQYCKPLEKDQRFARSLGVSLLREPPPHLETKKGVRYGDSASRKVPFFRFPQWYVCPSCRTMERVDLHASSRARSLICKVCLAEKDKTVRLQPTNYVVACGKGHLGDFPYSEYVHSEEGSLEKCSDPVNRLKLRALNDGDGYYIKCESCGAQRKFPPPFDHDIVCEGGRPWLGGKKHNEPCDEIVKVLHRNSANLYFPEVRRSICISTDKDSKTSEDSPLKYRYQEYQILKRGSQEDIDCKPQSMSAYGEDVKQWISSISLVYNMTETRALKGFSRIIPGANPVDITGTYQYEQNGQEKKVMWLPAYEVCGEGIFVALHKQKLAQIRQFYNLSDVISKFEGTQKEVEVSEELFIVHSLSHGLIHALSYKAGYSQSSLQERLYVSREHDMAGVLIYTAEGDQDGTLGGLVELGKPEFFNEAFRYMLETARWCSEDPLCTLSGKKNDSPNRAACHGCLFLPETSCELFNHFLDRTPLIGAH